MPRPRRAAEGGLVYHALNRANARLPIFETDEDYAAFERVLAQAVVRHEMRLLAYCLMPNHFHLLLWPREDGDLSQFMRWLTVTHTQRWHAHHRTAGTGHLYQGRFKSFPVESDDNFLTVCRYVERNALRANLVERAEDWRWGSLSARRAKADEERPQLAPWPIAQASRLDRARESAVRTEGGGGGMPKHSARPAVRFALVAGVGSRPARAGVAVPSSGSSTKGALK